MMIKIHVEPLMSGYLASGGVHMGHPILVISGTLCRHIYKV